MSALLMKRKYAVYDQIDRQTRSTMYKLCDRIEEITLWYASLPGPDKDRWKHPDAIAKHCPQQLLEGRMRNVPKGKGKKKRAATAEEDRLRQLLLALIYEFVMPVNPERARELIKLVYPEGDPNDSISDVAADVEL